MIKFKRIAAAVIAAATLATTMVTAGAAKTDIVIHEVTPTLDYVYAPYVHYTELSDYFDNIVTYNSVGRGVSSDCVVLSVDFAEKRNPNRVIPDYVYDEVAYYLEDLYLQDENGKFITEGKCPLIVDSWTFGENGRVNIIGGNNNLFKKFDITGATFYLGSRYDGNKNRDVLKLRYKIPGYAVLPSYKVTIGNTACDVKFGYNYIDDIDNGKCVTYGEMTVYIPHSVVGNGAALPISINGVKVAAITLLPSRSCPTYVNYN